MKLDSLLNRLKASKEDTNKVNLYRNICGTMRFTDPLKAIEYGKKGIILSKKLNFDKGTAGNYLNMATAFSYADKLDSALFYLNIAIQYSIKVGDPNRLGLAYLNRADTYRQQLNINAALNDCNTALKYAEKANNDDVKARVNQTIGAIYFLQKLYNEAVNYYNKAIPLYAKNNNKRMIAVVLNNIALVHKNTSHFPKAIVAFEQAIQILDSLKDVTNLSIFNANLSDAYFQIKNYKKAEIYGYKALQYAENQHNEKLIADAQLILASTFLTQNKLEISEELALKALAVFKEMDYTEKINIAADILADVNYKNGKYDKAYNYMKEVLSTNDSLFKWQYDDDLATMQAQFKLDEKDSEIKLLAKDKELQNQKITRQRLLFWGASLLSFLILIGFWLAYNRYKLRQQLKEYEIRNQIAADLHDEVGSSLSSIQMLSQMVNNQVNVDESGRAILAKMTTNAKETMEKMSDIVWMIKPGEQDVPALVERMKRFSTEIAESKNIEILFELGDLQKMELSMAQRKNIYLVFKEAINNAVKYSETQKIIIYLNIMQNNTILKVQDFGKGFEIERIRRGNGLDNMKNRAKEMEGSLEIVSEKNSGTTITLTFKT